MLRNSEIERFYEYVGSLDLKFPVAAIAKATGFSKGNVSDYLKKRKPPSENFLNTFYVKFPPGTHNVPRELRDHDNLSIKKEEPFDIYKSYLELVAAQKIRAEADKIQAEANKAQSEAGLISAKNFEELIAMLKSKSPTENVHDGDTHLDQLVQLADFLELIAEIGSGAKPWKSKKEGLEKLNRFVLEAAEAKIATDIPA